MNKTRQYGLDFLRILSMMLITVIHYVGYSGVLSAPDITIYNKAMLSFFYGLSVIAVNVFVLITGYFSCEKKTNVKRLVVLWVQVFAVGVIITLTATFLLKQPLGVGTLLKTIFPVTTMHYWFFTMYVVLMIMSPIINVVISNLSEKQHKTVCIVGFLIICVFFVSNPFIDSIYYTAHSRGIVWMAYLYFVGAYLKKYDFKISGKACAAIAIFILVIVCGLKFFQKEAVGNCELLETNAVFPFVLSVVIFCLFKNFSVKGNFPKIIISKLSACSFLVYILQEHNMLRKWYWGLFSIKSYAASPYLIINFIIALASLWVVALILQWLFEKALPFIELGYNKASKLVNKRSIIKREENYSIESRE